MQNPKERYEENFLEEIKNRFIGTKKNDAMEDLFYAAVAHANKCRQELEEERDEE